MERLEVKHIGSRVVDGIFEELLEVLDKKPDYLTQKQAIYFMVCCSNTCNSNINNCNKLNEQQLITVVKGLSVNIKNVNSEEYDNYIQSIFFICKFLLKKNYLLLLQLENEILPGFRPEPLTEKQKNVYRSICDWLQIEITNLAVTKTEVNEKMIILIGHLLSKIILKSSNQTKFLEYIFKFASCLQRLNINLASQFDFILYNISKIKKLPPGNVKTEILQFYNYGLYLFSTYLNNGKLVLSQQCINNMIDVLPEEWGYEEILNICKYITDPIAGKNNFVSRECIIRSFKLNRKSEHFLGIYKLLSQVMVSYSNFCKNHDNNKTFADPEKHMVIYEILSVMIDIFLKLSGSCVKECKCSLTNSSECSDTALCILTLFYRLLATNDITRDYTRRVKSFLEKYFESLVLRKQNKCEAYKKYWFDIAPHLHNVGVSLFRKKKYEEALSFVNMTLKYYSLLGILHNDVVLPSTFNLLNSIYLKQKKFKDALLWSAVEIINTEKNDRDKIFHKWIKIKVASREELSSELQEYTVISITEAVPANLVCFIEQIKTKESQIELLISELEMYQVKWRSKIPMMSSFRHLCEIADKSTIMRIFVHLFTDDETRVHENVPKLLKNVFEEFVNSNEETHSESLKLYCSFFYFFQYKYQTIDLISKNLEEMDKVTSLTKNSNNTNDVMPADAFDRCDIITAYENLKINGGKLNYLEKSLKTLEAIISPNLSKLFFAEVDPKKVYELTKNIAIEFILHSDFFNTLRSLFLASNIAQYLSDKHLLLECSSYFLRYLNFSDLKQKMEQIVCNLEDDQRSYQYLLQYYMNLSFFHLSDRNIELAYQHYKNAEKYWGDLLEENRKNLWCIEISLELLLFKLMKVAMSENFKMEVEFTYGPLMKAYNLVVNRYTTGTEWTTHSMVVLFEVYETLIKMYYDLKMPREVRCFGKQTLMLAQQHVIPVYSAKILSYLAHADIWSEKFDDCRVKLDGISDILLLEKSENGSKIMQQKKHLIVPSVNDIMEGINEMMLDNPPPLTFNVSSFPASPVLQGHAYQSPFFASHTFCKCFHCTSLECQKTILSRYHLEALWYMHKGQITLADSFFKGTFKLHESLSDKRKDIFKISHKYISKYSGNYGNFSVQDNEALLSFNEIKIYASINYTKFLSSSGALEAAKKFNDNAVKKFTDAKLHYPHLYGEMLLQKIALNFKQLENENRIAANIAECVDYKSNAEIKTPEACGPKSSTLIPKIHSPRIKKFLTPKVIKFNLADSETNATPLKASNKSTTTAKTPKSKIIPPSLRAINTPKLRTPSHKKKLNTDCKTVLSENSQNNMTGHDQPEKLPLSERSEGSDILSKNQEKILEGKTKLLTSRLRKKHVSENNSIDNEKIKEDIQPIRRSTRNRT